MINTEDFRKRLQKILDFYGESASSFAEKIGVQRSSISHILSGRNKPSLDFVMKVLSSYPEVELYWLMNGKGSFPNNTNSIIEKTTTSNSIPTPTQNIDLVIKKEKQTAKDTSIERIVIFYSDGSFKSFEN